ncbi:MAG: ABC transporter ATP-binding protein [Sphingorhabdus sp.]
MTLSVRNLVFSHDQRPALNDVSLDFKAGNLSIILGPNGAGKSTLLGCLAGLLKADQGTVELDGQDINRLRPKPRARAIGLLPQGGATHWAIDAEALVALGRFPHMHGNWPSDTDRMAIANAMEATATQSFAGRPVTSLSGGERARVLMARALAGEPKWLLADEPLTNLDPGFQLDMLETLRDQARQGMGVIAVLHDLHHAVRFADHVALLHRGELFAQGNTASVITPANLATVYGIDADLQTGKDGSFHLLIKGKSPS